MDIERYNYLWTNEKNDWVLVNTEYGYSIVNKASQTAFLISDDNLEDALIQQMLKEGNRIYDDINAAYADV